MILCLAVLIQYRRVVTDGQTYGRTDGRTHDDGYRASMATRGKMKAHFILTPCPNKKAPIDR